MNFQLNVFKVSHKGNQNGVFLSYRNQSIDFQNKSNHCFIYDGKTRFWSLNVSVLILNHDLPVCSQTSLVRKPGCKFFWHHFPMPKKCYDVLLLSLYLRHQNDVFWICFTCFGVSNVDFKQVNAYYHKAWYFITHSEMFLETVRPRFCWPVMKLF